LPPTLGLGDGLAFEKRLPELSPIEKLKMKLTTKSYITSATLELLLILNCSQLFFRLPAYCQTQCYRLAENLKLIETNKKVSFFT
jgi:hypothetical protein